MSSMLISAPQNCRIIGFIVAADEQGLSCIAWMLVRLVKPMFHPTKIRRHRLKSLQGALDKGLLRIAKSFLDSIKRILKGLSILEGA